MTPGSFSAASFFGFFLALTLVSGRNVARPKRFCFRNAIIFFAVATDGKCRLTYVHNYFVVLALNELLFCFYFYFLQFGTLFFKCYVYGLVFVYIYCLIMCFIANKAYF